MFISNGNRKKKRKERQTVHVKLPADIRIALHSVKIRDGEDIQDTVAAAVRWYLQEEKGVEFD